VVHRRSPLRCEEHATGVGAVDRSVAHRARLVFLRLVMERRHRGDRGIHGEGVALQAKQVDLAALEQSRVRRAVRDVAGDAALDLHGGVLVHERSGLIRVAFEANGVLRGGGAQLPREEASVRVVTIRALHQALVHTVMEGAAELLLDFDVAAIAELGLGHAHQELGLLRMVGRMAIDAADVVLQVGGAREVGVLLAILVALEAAVADLACGGILEREDSGFIAATLDVGLAGSVTGFAAVEFRALFGVERGDEVAGFLEGTVEALAGHVFVAGLAGVGAEVIGIGGGLGGSGDAFLVLSWGADAAEQQGDEAHQSDRWQDSKETPMDYSSHVSSRSDWTCTPLLRNQDCDREYEWRVQVTQ
jgi:hypothetical protein